MGGAIDPTLNFERRWVIYNGLAEASLIPPGWHGWIHNAADRRELQPREWEKPRVPNMTGTPADFGYSTEEKQKRQKVTTSVSEILAKTGTLQYSGRIL